MKTDDLENRMYKHAELVKSIITVPFDIKGEETIMVKRNYNVKRIVLIAAAAICLIGTTVFASYKLLGPKDVADALGDSKLAQYFEKEGSVSQTVTDGGYKATVLGVASGANLSKFESSSWKLFPERTYAVVAIEKADATAMTFDDDILVTPLIEGLSPWQYNIFTMNGGYTADIIDGVLYRIIEFDDIEYFADRNVYMAVISGGSLNNSVYSFDETTGAIAPKDDYSGTNILIKLELDKSKADPEKAAEYLKKSAEAQNTQDSDAQPAETEDTENVEVTQEMLESAPGETESAGEVVTQGIIGNETTETEGTKEVIITQEMIEKALEKNK